jgi:CO/xanthine dehydrogenase Mo-binding subunit
MGLAVQKASLDAKRQLFEMASKSLQIDMEKLEIKDGKVHGKGLEEKVVPFEKILSFEEIIGDRLLGGEIIGVGTFTSERNPAVPQGAPTPFWEAGCAATQVEVDRETGMIRIIRHLSLPDVGKMINPLMCRGQSEGSVMWGIGYALFEEMIYEDGTPINPNFVDYRLPRFSDMPKQLETIFIENEDGIGPHGAKGLGEGEVIPVAATIANAVYDAVGVRILDLPITPEKILRALKAKVS